MFGGVTVVGFWECEYRVVVIQKLMKKGCEESDEEDDEEMNERTKSLREEERCDLNKMQGRGPGQDLNPRQKKGHLAIINEYHSPILEKIILRDFFIFDRFWYFSRILTKIECTVHESKRQYSCVCVPISKHPMAINLSLLRVSQYIY